MGIGQWGDIYDDVLAPVMQTYFDDPSVKASLHAGSQVWKNGDGTAAPNPVVNALNKTLMDSALPDLELILDHGVPVRVYDGVLDGSSCNHISVYQAIKSMNSMRWTGKGKFFGSARKQWKLPGATHPAGYTQSGGGLTFVGGQ